MKKILLTLGVLTTIFGWSQTSVNYTMQTGLFDATRTVHTPSGYYAGAFNNNASEIGVYANGSGSSYTGNPGVALFRRFTTTGTNTGAERSLQVGDQFKITAYVANSNAFFDGGTAGISFNGNTDFADFSKVNVNQRLKFQISKNGTWFPQATNALNGYANAGQDVTFTFTVTSTNTMNVNISSANGSMTYDVDMANSPSVAGGNINSFAIWNQSSGTSNDMYWKNAVLENTNSIFIGNSGANKTLTGIITNGTSVNSNGAATLVNNVIKNGTGITTFNAANTYTGSTSIMAGIINIAQNNASKSYILSSGTSLGIHKSNAIANDSSMHLTSATINTGTGFSFTTNSLSLTGFNSLILGENAHDIRFNNLAGSGSLNINFWNGTPGNSNINGGRIIFGTTLTSAELSRITFASSGSKAIQLASGEVVPEGPNIISSATPFENTCLGSSSTTYLSLSNTGGLATGVSFSSSNPDFTFLPETLDHIDSDPVLVLVTFQGTAVGESTTDITINTDQGSFSGPQIIAHTYPQKTFYADSDNDGYGNPEDEVIECSLELSGFVTNNTDCDDQNSNINPGKTEILYNGFDDNCDGNLDEGNQILSQVLPSQCGTTLTALNSLIQVVSKSQATAYRFKVQKMLNGFPVGEPSFLEKPQPYFTLEQAGFQDYAAVFSISVEIQRNHIWLGYEGPSCQIASPAILDNGGALSVIPTFCNSVLPTISTFIYTTSLRGATAYKYRVTDLTNSNIAPQEIERPYHYFALSMLNNYNYGSDYMIEVAVKTNGDYTGYGAPCIISTPAVPMLTSCDVRVALPTTYVHTSSMNKATSYRFELTLVDEFDNPMGSAMIDRPLQYFNFNQVPNYQAGRRYIVRVALMTSGTWSPFGDGCYITAPGGSRLVQNSDVINFDLKVVGYPNPFKGEFNLSVETASEEPINVQVYDMLGRQLENNTYGISEIELKSFGSEYPAGVYNLIIKQNNDVKSVRLIKQ